MNTETSDIPIEPRFREWSLRDLYYVLFRHKRKMIVFALGALVVVTVFTFLSPDIYRSEARLLVRVGRESVALDPTATTGQILTISQSRESEIESEVQILKSQGLIEKVVASIGAGVFLDTTESDLTAEDREEVVHAVMDDLEIDVLRDSNILSIAYEGRDPDHTRSVVARLIEIYLDKHLAVHRTPGSHQFFVDQSDQLRAGLAQLEDDLRNLKNEIGISSLAEQRLVLLDRIGSLNREKEQTDAALAATKAKVQTLEQSLAGIPETVVIQETRGFPNIAADGMRQRLYELQLKEQDLLSGFTEESRVVQDVRRQITEAQALLEQEEPVRNQVTEGLSTAYQQVQSALLTEIPLLESLRAKSAVLQEQLSDAEARLPSFNDGEVKLRRLEREMSIKASNYRTYTENLEQARIDNALEIEKISNISIVQPATLPIKPVRPRKALNLALGVLLALFGGVGLAFVCEYVDHSIKTPEEAEQRLGIPTLGSIGWREQDTEGSDLANGTQDATGATALWSKFLDLGPVRRLSAFRVNDQGKRATSAAGRSNVSATIRKHYETFDDFRDRLLLHADAHTKNLRVVAVTGCHRGDGASTIAAHLAVSLAWRGEGRVLLVDANISDPSVHRIFKTKLAPGLTGLLKGAPSNGSTIQAAPIENLHILSAGTKTESLSEIFTTERFSTFLNSLNDRFRYVVIDAPAVNEVSSTARLTGLCDGVVLVVEAERSRWEVAQRAKDRLVESNANVLGLVLNKRRFHIPEWLYRTL